MSDQNGKPELPTDLQVVKGGQEIDVTFVDQSEPAGRVKIRLPNIRLLELYEDLQTDEASLVELFVDKLDTTTLFKARRLYRERASLNELRAPVKTVTRKEKDGGTTQEVTPILASLEERQLIDAQISKIDIELEEIRNQQRWDDTISPQSHNAIYELGLKLWYPLYERWQKNTREANARQRARVEALLQAMAPKKESGSAASSPSAASL